MSYPYRGSTKDFKSSPSSRVASDYSQLGRHDVYRTSQESSGGTVSSYMSSKSTLESCTSQRSSTTEHALSVLASCGLDPEDLSLLAGMPDNLITVETLPHLLIDIKEKKAERERTRSTSRVASSARPLRSLVDDWRGGTSFSSEADPPRCHDRPSEPRRTGSAPLELPRPRPGYTVDYNFGHTREVVSRGCDGLASTLRAGKEQDGTAGYHGADRSARSRVGWKPPSGYWGDNDVVRVQSSCEPSAGSSTVRGTKERDTQRSPASYWGVDETVRRDNSRERVVSYRNSREHPAEYQGVIRPARYGTGPESVAGYQSVDRDLRPGAAPSVSADYRRPSGNIRAGRSQESFTGRWATEKGSGPSLSTYRKNIALSKHPTKQEAADFHGLMPQSFPYACSLCDVAVLSERDWTSHINGSQHADSQLSVLHMYPEWDCRTDSTRGRPGQPGPIKEAENPERARYGAAHFPAVRPSGGKVYKAVKDKERSRIVCVKFPAESVDESYLMKLIRPFGSAVNVSFFPMKAFLEMSTCLQAEEIVMFYGKNPVLLSGCQVQFSLSTTFTFSQSSRVVCFSRLPPGKEKNTELIAMAKRFGQVKHSLFLPERVFVEMANAEDAGKLVDHYAAHPLKMKGKNVLVSYSKEYSTLKEESSDTDSEGGQRPKKSRRRSPSPRRQSPSPRQQSPSPRRQSPSPRRQSPSPRRQSSCPSRRSTETEGASKEPQQTSDTTKPEVLPEETTVEVRGHDQCSIGLDKGLSPDNLQYSPGEPTSSPSVAECAEGTQQEQRYSADPDSDIEGMEVIGEDGEDIVLDETLVMEDRAERVEGQWAAGHGVAELGTSRPEGTSLNSAMDQPSEKLTSQWVMEDVKGETCPELRSESTQELSPGQDQENRLNASEEEDPDFPESLENCITLDELEEEDEDEEGEKKPSLAQEHDNSSGPRSKQESENHFQGKVIYIRNLPQVYYTDAEFVRIVKGFGRVTRYFLIRSRQEGFIEMETAEDAQRAAKELVLRRTVMRHSALMIHLSRKYKKLTSGWTPDPDSEEEEEQRRKERSATSMTREERSNCQPKPDAVQEKTCTERSCAQAEGAPTEELGTAAKQEKEEKQEEDKQKETEEQGSSPKVPSDQEEVKVNTEDTVMKAERASNSRDVHVDAQENGFQKPTCESPVTGLSNAPTEQTHVEEHEVDMPVGPVGQEFVHPVVGYYCRLCEAIYYSEEEAKNLHCAGVSHRQKVKEHQANSSRT